MTRQTKLLVDFKDQSCQMDRKENQSPQRELVEFLEVAITSIIFLKGIYPPGAFERRRYMNLLVHRARYPQLNHYIHHSLNKLVPYIQQGLVERVAVIFFRDDKIPVERFVFKVKVNVNQCFEDGGAGVMMDLRSFLMKLSLSQPLSATVCQDWKWEITGYFCSVPEAEAGVWILSNTQQWKQPPLITPIKSMNTDPLSVQLYLEHPPTNY